MKRKKAAEGKQALYKLFAILAVVVLSLTAYTRVFDNEFVDWDDFTYVVNNEMVRGTSGNVLEEIFTTPVSSNYHPLTILSLRLNNNDCPECPHGISPAPFIRWNVILHLVNSLLVFWLIYMLSGGKVLVSFLTAVVFGLHPLHVESVAWISERKDLLYSFFFLAGLLSWVYFRQHSRRRYIFYLLAFILFSASCLSKAVAVVFPVAVLLIDYWLDPECDGAAFTEVVGKLFSPGRVLLLLPFLALSLFIGLQAYYLQDGQNFLGLLRVEKPLPDMVNSAIDINILQKAGIAFYGIAAYLFTFLFPFGLSAIYPYPSVEVMNSPGFSVLLGLAAAAVTVMIFFVIRSMKKTKVFAFGAGFFLITVVLVLQIISVGIALRADRYAYLPLAGPAFIAACLIASASTDRFRKLLYITAGAFIILFWALTFIRANVWQNTEALWTNTIEKYPLLETPRSSRGKYYTRMSLKAEDEYRKRYYEEKALADFLVAVKSKPLKSDVYEGTGYLFAVKGDHLRAIEFFNTAIMIDRANGSAYYNRALANTSLGRTEEAITDYNLALKYRPQQAREIITNRSNLLLGLGRLAEAMPDLDYLISIEPGNPDHYYNRSAARIVSGDIAGAVADLEKVLKLSPGDREAGERLQKLLKR